MKYLKEPPLHIVVFTDEENKWIKRRFTIAREHYEAIERILDNREKATFGEDNSISYSIKRKEGN